MALRTLTGFTVALVLFFAGSSLAQPQPPTYTGEVCLSGGVTTITATATPTATAMLIYPVPPGGGYFMSDGGSGTYTHTINGLSAGTSLTFHLVIQVPQQFEFPTHTITLADGCTSFASDNPGGGGDDDDDDDDDDGGEDGGGTGAVPQTPRNFRQDLTTNGEITALRFECGPPGSPLPATVAVKANYRINGGELQSSTMTNIGGFVWRKNLPEVVEGDLLDYFFTQTVGQQIIDTAWFRRVVGQPAPPAPTYPLVTEGTARFRDRHANEWRFDHYVQGYDVGRTFDFSITDHGNSLDVQVITQTDVPVNAIDIKWFDQAGPQSFCGRANSAISMRMTKSGNTFDANIPNLMFGQVVDIELTLLAAQTYYSEFFYYYVGSGKLEQRWQHPWAYAAGDASVSVVTIKQFAFNQHALNLTPAEMTEFMEGKVLFETNFQNGTLFNPPTAFDCNGGPVGFNMGPSPQFQAGALGPIYNNVSCIQCHMLDGRGKAPAGPADSLDHLTVRVSVPGADSQGGPQPHPYYGTQLAHRAIPGISPEGVPTITYQTVNGQFNDGTPYTLRRPVAGFSEMAFGPLGTNVPGESAPNPPVPPYDDEAEYSLRIAPMLIGLGMLEAVSEQTILQFADPTDADQDGISGRPNYVWDAEQAEHRLGRFGWKAGQPSLKQQAASAFLHDMGLTSSLFPEHSCSPVDSACLANADNQIPEIDAASLELLTTYLRGLTVPPRENYNNPDAQSGKLLFEQANCQACHRPTVTTGDDYPIEGFRNQAIQPFTDLLLHDMGDDLADNRPEFQANGREWRTPPLWAVGLVGHVLGVPTAPFDPNGNPAEPNYLHDGRARSLMEAILWHGGEAEQSKLAVLAMSASERDALIAYVQYPFADPPHLSAGCGTGVTGDVDGDGDISLDDFEGFAACTANGPCVNPPCTTPLFANPACCNADSDGDGDVDLRDYAEFISAIDGG